MYLVNEIYNASLTLCILYSGGSAPSYVYRLIGEMYNSDDRDL